MPVFHAESGLEYAGHVHFVVAVGVLKEVEVRCSTEINAAIAQRDSGRERIAIGKHSDFVRDTIGVRVFENLDAVAALLTFRRPLGIFV